ncbi:MAG: RES domain-containing protein, partial [Pseudomonadota bacterium]
MNAERLKDRWCWWRIVERDWVDPLDPGFAHRRGGRWNPPDSFPTLYLNEDKVTARLNLRSFIAQWPYEPEDLRADTGPVLVGATLPRRQTVCDAHTPEGLAALALPNSYPLDGAG